tara:strand:- start:951 stop:1634 length:684 start_codon:yes stop_codon:yes gene_type:complete
MKLDPKQLKEIQLFSKLKESEAEFLLSEHLTSSIDSHQNIILEQDWGKTLFLIGRGIAKIRSITLDGEEVIYAIAGEGDVFGEIAGLQDDTRSADVLSLTSMTIYKFPEKKYIQLLNSSALFSLELAKYQANKLRNLNQRFTIQKGDATTRYLDAFAYLARKLSLMSSIYSPVPKTLQKEISSIAGLSRETASRTLAKLKRRGVIIESEIGLKIEDEHSLNKRGISY